jgi:hypothetical protein
MGLMATKKMMKSKALEIIMVLEIMAMILASEEGGMLIRSIRK